ncbi:MAG: hypothetical protein JSS65_03345 [Armatimonadetes bacterium]|nr:hypothetical protein [Armatimonadota bacterium]
MRSILFCSAKGGVGKTTVAGHVSACLAGQGTNVAMVTTAEADWAKAENLTVLSTSLDGLREAVNHGQSVAGSGVFVLDVPACDGTAGWWVGDADVVLVSDFEASSLYAALQTARTWTEAGHAPVGFVLAKAESASTAAEVAGLFRSAASRFGSMALPFLGSVPATRDSAALLGRGRFCTGKALAPYEAIAKKLNAERSTADKVEVLEALKTRRDKLRAA